MANLADFISEGSGKKYLGKGIHAVEVTAIRVFKYNSGTKGIEVTCSNAEGKSSTSFSLSGKGPRRLAAFAAACGMPKETMKKYNLDDDSSHELLIGSNLKVEVNEDEKGYHEITAWYSKDSDAEYVEPMKSTQQSTKQDEDDGEAIPF